MSYTDKLKVELYDEVVNEKNKQYIELSCRFRETCNDIKKKDKEIARLKEENNFLKLNNPQMNLEHFRVVKENKRKMDNLRQVNKRLNNIINELEKDFERKIQSCTIEAETTTNDFYCRLHISALKRWLNKIQELKGSDKE